MMRKIVFFTFFTILMIKINSAYSMPAYVGAGYLVNNATTNDLTDNEDGTYTFNQYGHSYTGVLHNGIFYCQKDESTEGTWEYSYDDNYRPSGATVTYPNGRIYKTEDVYSSDYDSYYSSSNSITIDPEGVLEGANGNDGYISLSDKNYVFRGRDLMGKYPYDYSTDSASISSLEYYYDENGNLSYVSAWIEEVEYYQECNPSYDNYGDVIGEECYEYPMSSGRSETCYVNNISSCTSVFANILNNIESTLPQLLTRLGVNNLLNNNVTLAGGASASIASGATGGNGGVVSGNGTPKTKRLYYTPVEAAEHVNHTNNNRIIFTFK